MGEILAVPGGDRFSMLTVVSGIKDRWLNSNLRTLCNNDAPEYNIFKFRYDGCPNTHFKIMDRIQNLRNQFKQDDLQLTYDTGVLSRADREFYEVLCNCTCSEKWVLGSREDVFR